MTATVHRLDEAAASMTFEDGREFIARTRRQLDRFSELSGAEGRKLDPQEEAEIRRLCEELDTEINASLSPLGAPANDS